MIIQPIITERFQFKDWVWDRNGHYVSLSTVIIGQKVLSEVVLTIYENNTEEINDHTNQYGKDILENLNGLDEKVDDFCNGTLLEIFDKNGKIRYSLMFFDPQ